MVLRISLGGVDKSEKIEECLNLRLDRKVMV